MKKLSFYFVIDYRGRHWKGIAIYNVSGVNLSQKHLLFMNKNVFFEHLRMVKTIHNLYNYNNLILNILIYLFRAACHVFIFVLHRGALLYWLLVTNTLTYFCTELIRLNNPPVSATRCQFHQHFMSSFCAKLLSPKNYKPKL